MAEGYSILVDTSKCTACRGCQISCKQWNQLPGTKTQNVGTYKTQRTFRPTPTRWCDSRKGPMATASRLALFHGAMPALPIAWMHGGVENDEIVQDEKTGAVIYTEKTKDLDFKATLEGCPSNIPRQDPKTKVLVKCTMCFDRITNNMIPACVKSMSNRYHDLRGKGQDPGDGKEKSGGY